MQLVDYDFDLPDALIAQRPTLERDQARLLLLNRADGSLQHLHFGAIVDQLAPGDALVLNQTQVVPARLRGRKVATGGRVELLLLRPLTAGDWLAMGRPGRGLKPKTRLEFGDGAVEAHIVEQVAPGRFRVRFAVEDVLARLEEIGEIPLPPYIRRLPEAADQERYQTVYAARPGAVAAPTAGLHFTPQLIAEIAAKGVAVLKVLLHVGPGTFEPVRCADPRQHVLEPEYCEIDESVADALRRCRAAGGRIVAVGTTVVRTLESSVDAEGNVCARGGLADAFIYPPYAFKAVDMLVTNFHLPRSSLLLLVAAFVGRERLLAAYREAIERGYRFYSYGDAMMIV